jgi:hypothetical protein
MTKNYHHPTFVQYKKSHINLFLLYSLKNKFNKRKEKNLKRKINKIGNILKRKKIKAKEISCWCIERCFVMRYSWCNCKKYFI